MKKRRVLLSISVVMVFLSLSLCFGAPDSNLFPDKRPFEITRITPEGSDAPQGREIVIQFSKPVVPLGRMERRKEEVPVIISPGVKGQWRWLDTSTLSLQLDDTNALKPATRYRIIVKPGIKTLEGETIDKETRHEFITQRPGAIAAYFVTWTSPVRPVILVSFDQPVSIDSVKECMVFRSTEAEKPLVRVTVSPDPDESEKPLFLSSQALGGVGAEKRGVEARRFWRIAPESDLPEDASVELFLEPGLLSALGPEKGVGNQQVTRFHTFPRFRFLGMRYNTLSGKEPILRSPESLRESMDAEKANPIEGVYLVFNSPVLSGEIKNKVVFDPDLAGGVKEHDPWEGQQSYSSLGGSHEKDQEYGVYLPVFLKADQCYRMKEKSPGVKDEFGRALESPIDTAFMTDHRKPDFNLLNTISVLEEKMATEPPLAVTNLKSVRLTARSLTAGGVKEGLSLDKGIPDVKDVAFLIPLGVRELLGQKPGVVYGTIQTDPPVEKHDTERRFFSQVTPFQVIAKMGHFNTLVWVTDLATGEPVSGAEVSMVTDVKNALKADAPVLAKAVTAADGSVYLPGNETLDPDLSVDRYSYRKEEEQTFFVKVRAGEHMALLPISSDFEIDTWRVSNYSVSSGSSKKYGHIKSWGATAQGLYRAGDSISYKIYVRNQDNTGSVPPPSKTYHLTVKDPMDQTVFERKKIELSGFGACDGSFKVPEKGAVGWYRFELSADFTEETWSPMVVLVSDFTPSPFKVKSDLSQDFFRTGDMVSVTASGRLHAGGPYSLAAARIVARLQEEPFESQDPVAKNFYFSTMGDREGERNRALYDTQEHLNDRGDLLVTFPVTESEILCGRIDVESSVRDDRGKWVSALSSAPFSGRDRFVGMRAQKWVYAQGEPAAFSYIAVDETGKPLDAIPATLIAERMEVTAAKVKGPGNAYLTQSNVTWVKEEERLGVCEKEGSTYAFTPKQTGSYRITAEIKDAKGRSHKTALETYVVGKGVALWAGAEEGTLDIIPEKSEMTVGEKARYLVKNPFPGALALVTVERYGVMKHWIERLETSTPIIEVPVIEDYMPGFFVSVTLLSKRVSDAPMDGDVDLGKPAFRTGYVQSTVRNTAKEISVKVKTKEAVYKPGERVTVSFKADDKSNGEKEPVELAVVALDEAVFDLILGGKAYFDPYTGFNHVESLDVATYNLLSQLVGRTRFEKKGANPGGDGGNKLGMRSVFDFVSYWNPSLVTDKKGRAEVSFTVPESLTGWKIFAMAVTPSDRMGLGVGEFKVNQPTEIRQAMPNLVRDGDTFKAGFTVMNRTDTLRTLACTIDVKGPLHPSMIESSSDMVVVAPPYQRMEIWLPVQTLGIGKLSFSVTAKDSIDGDALLTEVPVIPKKHMETVATYGTTTAAEVTETLLVPEGVKIGSGEISVRLSPTVIGNLEGAFAYMRDYPYACWEQILGKAVSASNYLLLKPYLSPEFSWPEAETLVKESLSQAIRFQTPSGAISFFVPDDRYGSPYLSAYTALAFTWLKKRGYTLPEPVTSTLFSYLDGLLKREVFPEFYSKGMGESVRAAALLALAENDQLTLSDLKRYETNASMMDLFGKALFMQAALKTKGGEAIAESMCRNILGYANATSGQYLFSETKEKGFARILSTPLRDNAAILSAFSAFSQRKNGKALVGDTPHKLVRAITQTRKNRTHWENTQESIFCMKALWDYAQIYEKEKPAMSVSVHLEDELLGTASFKDVKAAPKYVKRELLPQDPGSKERLTLKKEGGGRLYYSPMITFERSEERGEKVNAGIDIQKEISVERKGKWMKLASPCSIKQGELVRVDIFVILSGPRHFVVVDDAIPGGLEPVNRDLATASRFDAEKGDFKASGGSFWFTYTEWQEYNSSLWNFNHRELRHESVRFYSDYLPPGHYHLSYTAQAICEGEFAMTPVHAEEMYDPDVFGEGVSGVMRIE